VRTGVSPDPEPPPDTRLRGGAGAHESAAQIADRVLDEVETGLDAMVSAIVDTIRREIPEYGPATADAALAEDVEETARRVVTLALRLLRERRRPGAGDRVVMGLIGTRRAEHGVSLESLVGSVRIARGIGWTHTVEASRRIDMGTEGVRAVGDLAALLFGVVDDIVDAMTAGYLRVHDSRTKARERTRSQVFDDLLNGAFDEEDEIVVRARTFGFDLRRSHGLVLLTNARPDQDRSLIRGAVTSLLQTIGNAAEVPMTADVTPHVALVVPTSSVTWDEVIDATQRIARQHRVTAVLAAPVAGARNIQGSYRRARDMLPLAITVFRRPHVIEADELVVYQILRGSRAEDREDFLQRTLGPVLHLPEMQRSPLLETLDALHEGNGHTETAAAMLGVHTNTVRYRIGRLHHLTGLRYDHPPDRFKLEVATILLRMAGGIEGLRRLL
jgi:DNA-binding PucR family transcriptional regulator